jgi:hypothetical protein
MLAGAVDNAPLSCGVNLEKESDVNEKELYQKKLRAQEDEWDAELAKLKAKAAKADAEAKLEMLRQAGMLEAKIGEFKSKVAELAEAGDDAWESIKDGVDSAWKSLKSSFSEAASKFKH